MPARPAGGACRCRPGCAPRWRPSSREHHVERVFHKRQRDRADPEALGARGRRASAARAAEDERMSEARRRLPRPLVAPQARPVQRSHRRRRRRRRRRPPPDADAAEPSLRSRQPAAAREPDAASDFAAFLRPECPRRCAGGAAAGLDARPRHPELRRPGRLRLGLQRARRRARLRAGTRRATWSGCWPRRSACEERRRAEAPPERGAAAREAAGPPGAPAMPMRRRRRGRSRPPAAAPRDGGAERAARPGARRPRQRRRVLSARTAGRCAG